MRSKCRTHFPTSSGFRVFFTRRDGSGMFRKARSIGWYHKKKNTFFFFFFCQRVVRVKQEIIQSVALWEWLRNWATLDDWKWEGGGGRRGRETKCVGVPDFAHKKCVVWKIWELLNSWTFKISRSEWRRLRFCRQKGGEKKTWLIMCVFFPFDLLK